MPSTGEGFGIVLIEAAACGLPIVGSAVDGSREALLNGALGIVYFRTFRPSNGQYSMCSLVLLGSKSPRSVRSGRMRFGIVLRHGLLSNPFWPTVLQ